MKRWVCPYHQWSYGLDGRLLGSGGIENQLDRDRYGLHRAAVNEVGGLVFVRLTGPPERFDDAGRDLGAALAPQGLQRAKIAHQIDYDVRANWKLIWHNNRECWHCHAGHPEYIRANFDTAPGFVTESLDGSPVSTLMGDYPGYDVGTLRVRTVPNFWLHASADHAVLTPDWTLCERNHSGIGNPAFTPGPYSPTREYDLAAFDSWYLTRLRT